MTEFGLIRVLVVDDSAFMRKVIREMLEESAQIEVVGTAWNAEDALEKAAELRPDVVTVDLFMPGKDGIWLIQQLIERHNAPAVVCSSALNATSVVISAMEAGAFGFVQKPTAMALDQMYRIKTELIQEVLSAAAVPRERIVSPRPDLLGALGYTHAYNGSVKVDAVVIGVSTGGPRALNTILPRFPADFPVPIAIALHISPGYTLAMAKKLNEISQLEVLESAQGLEMRPGRVILAQAGLNTTLRRTLEGQVVTDLSDQLDDFLYIPSVDELFRSAALAYHDRLLGVVLTGMGSDGTEGAAWIKSQGGKVIAESETSSIIYGMPRSVVEAGLADRVVDLERIPEAIMEAIV